MNRKEFFVTIPNRTPVFLFSCECLAFLILRLAGLVKRVSYLAPEKLAEFQ